MRVLLLPVSSISNITNNNNSTVNNLNRGIPQIKYDIIKINDAYIWQKSEGGDIPVGHITEIKELFLESINNESKIDLTNSIKEIRVKYGN